MQPTHRPSSAKDWPSPCVAAPYISGPLSAPLHPSPAVSHSRRLQPFTAPATALGARNMLGQAGTGIKSDMCAQVPGAAHPGSHRRHLLCCGVPERASIRAAVPGPPHSAAHARRRACKLLQLWRRRCAICALQSRSYGGSVKGFPVIGCSGGNEDTLIFPSPISL